jgi:hypothetical protein
MKGLLKVCYLILKLSVIVVAFELSFILANETAPQSVGKLRSSADAAFSKGEMDQALKLWAKVTIAIN